MCWGILAPDTVVSHRRQQNLGLASAVRYFNDRAVPGIGGMWFAALADDKVIFGNPKDGYRLTQEGMVRAVGLVRKLVEAKQAAA